MPYALKFLFLAEYADGSITQTPEDVSANDPRRSAFFDVDPSRVVRFNLRPADLPYPVASVDLRTGIFRVGDDFFSLEDDGAIPTTDRRLVYFRRHYHTFGYSGDDGLGEERSHVVEFHFGYEGRTADGEMRTFTTFIQ